MINKFIKISNVGRFKDYNATGDISFRNLTLIYAENGCGKTTISHILRSLSSGVISHIVERNALSTSSDPEIVIRANTQTIQFSKGAWSSTLDNIEIFDTTFVNENVYSGYYVGVEHKRKLHRFIVGEHGINLSNRVDELANKIKQANTKIKDKESDIEMVIESDLKVSEFVKLEADPSIDTKIEEKQKEILALEKQSELLTKSELLTLDMPAFDSTIVSTVLSKKLDDIETRALSLVQQHLKHLDGKGEEWIHEGQELVKDDNCPFCGQTLVGVDLIKAYQGYFSEEYNGLKEEINNVLTSLKRDFSNSSLLKITNYIAENDTSALSWAKYGVNSPINPLDTVAIQTSWKALEAIVDELFEVKSQNPLDAVKTNDKFSNAIDNYEQILASIDAYNLSITRFNENIDKVKKQASVGDLIKTQTELLKLQDTKKRQDPKVVTTCSEYITAKKEKRDYENEKAKARDDLNTYTRDIIEKYEKQINRHLSKFGASFKISKSKKPNYSGGKPSTEYYIQLDGEKIELGRVDTPPGEPTFRTLLSEGDKNTLAFAFFMARLDLMDNLEDKIVVFDDPVSSLDGHRKEATKFYISHIAKKAKQVVVLAHDKQYLRLTWDDCDKVNTKLLEIKRSGDASVMQEWDILAATLSEYEENYSKLIEYVEKGPAECDPLDVARCIRPVLESNLRHRFPSSFKHGKYLGDYVGQIRESDPSDEISVLKSVLLDLDGLNEFSKKFHHGQRTMPMSPEDSALRPQVEDTIRFIQGN